MGAMEAPVSILKTQARAAKFNLLENSVVGDMPWTIVRCGKGE
jgi:hypothetical protein